MTDMFVIVGSNLIWNQNGEILLVQEGKDRAEDLWNLPGGTLEHSEQPRTCAIREAEEEVGLTIEPSHLLGLYLGTGDYGKDRVLNICYESTVYDQSPTVGEDDTVKDCEWTDPDDLTGYELRAAYIPQAVVDAQAGHTLPDRTITELFT